MMPETASVADVELVVPCRMPLVGALYPPSSFQRRLSAQRTRLLPSVCSLNHQTFTEQVMSSQLS